MNQCKNILMLHDMALDYENYVTTDADHLWEKRAEMCKKDDPEVLREVIPALNTIIQDAEIYKNWILQELSEFTEEVTNEKN